MYKLRYRADVEAVWDALPDAARRELDLALAEVCRDPYATTEPHGKDGDVTRILKLRHTRSVLLVIEPGLRVRIISINYLG
ncbi:hypothetical protein [Streptomyces sp. WMMB 322]|uniref:hypothetical protein n=1 Tax=Streptomyces sp. WMMB 322 TaxID=1286821 RepID=UPI0006E2883C|nr:hypothetical protein [Streptomyces sp. WMMB 322]SCK42093.1 hypothetical protein H180DRAFT_03652 [Streptomyces sp. WMMB 322]